MLKFIFGCPSSGKTYTVLNMIKELSERGKETVLIVPEQFSFESERAVLKTVGDKATLNVTVTSFSRLLDEVGRNVGGIAGETLTNADKVIFMNRALRSVQDELKLWSHYCNSVFFAKTVLDTIGEFKINFVTPEDLKKAAEETDSVTLSYKLHDIAKIYETFDALLGERFIDPADNLTRLYRQLENYRFFEEKSVFIDSFKGFTGQQYKIIDRILCQADNLTVSLTNDPKLDKEYNVFANIRIAAEKIKRAAERFSVAVDEPLILEAKYGINESISALERLLAGDEIPHVDNGGISVVSAATTSDEADFAARTIRRLVREKGYRYRDFVIISRDAEKYGESVFSACKQNGVPCFGDRREPLSGFPVASAVESAIEFAISLKSENIFRFHKSGIGMLSLEEISELENYCLLWNIEGENWNINWTMNPKGFVSEDENKDDNKEKNDQKLKTLNMLRKKALAPLEKFKEEFKGRAQDRARAIVNLLKECSATEKLAEISGRFKNEGAQFSSDVLKQSYEKYMTLLNSLAHCFGESEIKGKDFYEALKLSVSLDSVGVIPRMLDEVTFGAADRIRPSRPKAAFILGANQGVFPRGLSQGGMLRINERRKLIELGIEIPDNQISSVIDENYLVYCNLCCPKDLLYISYATHSLSGESYEPSAFIEEIKENLNCDFIKVPYSELTDNGLPETEEGAYSEYCRRKINSKGANEIKTALAGSNFGEKIDYLDQKTENTPNKISTETAEKLFGTDIEMSASKFDVFHKCRFYYFCKYGIKAKKIQPAQFDVLQRGTVVHFVLEKIVKEYKKGLSELTEEETNNLVDKYIGEYLDGVSGFRDVETERTQFLVSRISRTLKAVVRQLCSEFAQSDFEPIACELKIGNGGDIPELKIPFDKGEVSVIGSIDRVDGYNGYIRVVDYKTGTKSFKLPDILFGLNLQMLIYLYAAVRYRGLGDEKAAGILYMPSKRDLNDSGMAMNGLIRPEPEIVSAMDKEMNGEFVPKLLLTTKGLLNRKATSFAYSEEFTEIFDYIERLMKQTGEDIVSGDIAANPLDGRETPACKYCDFSRVCGRENAPCERVPKMSNTDVFKKMRGEETDGI